MERLNNNNNEPVGSLQISRDVIGAIAGTCTQEVEGVAGLARRVSNFNDGPFRGQGVSPVGVTLKDNSVEINVGVSLKYGAKVTETCMAIQQCVKNTVQTMTGMAVSKVNVRVSRIVFPSEKPEGA